jgi:hypothetical protein
MQTLQKSSSAAMGSQKISIVKTGDRMQKMQHSGMQLYIQSYQAME